MLILRMKSKNGYSDFRRKEFFRSVSATKLFTIKSYVEAGYTTSDLVRTFRLTDQEAKFFYLEFRPGPPELKSILGGKREPYCEGEFPLSLPKYKIKDLKGDELEILKRLENGQNEGDLH
jgi:hypothetical protein